MCTSLSVRSYRIALYLLNVCRLQCECRGERTHYERWFSPSIRREPGTEPRLSCLANRQALVYYVFRFHRRAHFPFRGGMQRFTSAPKKLAIKRTPLSCMSAEGVSVSPGAVNGFSSSVLWPVKARACAIGQPTHGRCVCSGTSPWSLLGFVPAHVELSLHQSLPNKRTKTHTDRP